LQVKGSFYLSNTASDCGQWIEGGGGGWSFIQYRNMGTDKFIQGYRDADALYHIAPGDSLVTNTGLNMNNSGRINIGGNSFNGYLTLQGSHIGGYGLLNLESSDNCLISMNSSTSYDVRIRYKYNSVDQWFVGMATDDVFRWHNAGGSNSLTLTQAGVLTALSSIYATSFFESSDSRLKTLIQDNYQTKGVASITPKLYTKNGKVELGYYAQDFVGILDSAISKSDDDMLSLSYREVLVAKVYALEQEIKELKAKSN
jgi:hypothetical protein